jgi:hypothetical protein
VGQIDEGRYEFDHAADPIGISPTTSTGAESESFDLPQAETPISIEAATPTDPEDVKPRPSNPVPMMKRYTLPAAVAPATEGNAVKVVPMVRDFRRAVWILSRGAGGLQASYDPLFNDPDIVDVQVNGIPIPLFPLQDLWMRVIDANPGDDLEISIIAEPRGSGR